MVDAGEFSSLEDLTFASRDLYKECGLATDVCRAPSVKTSALLPKSVQTHRTSRRLYAMRRALAPALSVAANSTVMNEQVIVEELPNDTLSVDCFRLQSVPAPTAKSLDKGQVLCETIAFVIAAGQRAGLQGSASYAGAPVTGVVMGGSSISRVVASKDSSICVGALVSSNGWERFTVQDAGSLTQYEEGCDGLDPVHHVGVLGGNGLTAYFGLLDVGKPQPGETVVVSGAAGSVGHLVCQLAKNVGCRVVGIAGTRASLEQAITLRLAQTNIHDPRDSRRP